MTERLEYVDLLSAVGELQIAVDPESLHLCREATAAMLALDPFTSETLAQLFGERPAYVEVAAIAVGLPRERFKTWLKDRFDTAGWVTLARQRAPELVDAMNEDFALLEFLAGERHREWTWGDALAMAMAGRRSARGAVAQGRALEDEVEAILDGLGLTFEARTFFEGSGRETAPADFVVRNADGDVQIAIAVKGMDSTGSKLTDAAREIESMATVRTPGQYVFAVVDGLGWKRRVSDLRRILKLADSRRIEGVYSRATFDELTLKLRDAAVRSKLLEP